MAAANSITVKALDLITSAMQEIGALAAGEVPSNDDQAQVMTKLQRLIDRYNAVRTMIYNVNFTQFTLPTNIHPVTIGPGANFDVNQRPVEIPSISLILIGTTGTETEIPLNPRDDDWWANQRVKNLTSTMPTDYYYSTDWPNGAIFFWPIPTQVNDVLIESRGVIGEITAYNANFSMPPGYWDAVVYELAESIGPMFERPISADLLRLKMRAIKAVQGNNVKSPRGTTGDAGMPGIGVHGDFNYVTGMPN
jgi:hypothetical protein